MRGHRAAAVGINPKGVRSVFQVAVAESGAQRMAVSCTVPRRTLRAPKMAWR